MHIVNKRYWIWPLDIILMCLSYFLAHIIRYENLDFFQDQNRFFTSLSIVVGTRSIIFLFSAIYKSLWSYASIHDLIEIIKTTILSSLVANSALLFYNRFEQHSRMVPILDSILLLSFLCVRSFSWRILRDEYLSRTSVFSKPTLIIGAGKAGISLATEIRRHPELSLYPIGFLDDDPNIIGANIQGIPVLGNLDFLDSILKEEKVEEIIITSSHLSGKEISKLIERAESEKIHTRILPAISLLFKEGGKPNFKNLRDVKVEDLLGRDPVSLEMESIQSYIQGKTVLITGAGGSIGSEISRQVSHFSPAKVLLLDCSETPLYQIDYELRTHFPELELYSIIADIKNFSRVDSIFAEYKPEVVFHCAAYKHVPLMELNPSEAVLNNVMGTKNLVDISRHTFVERFVMISTDKAVNPVNIMGATKRAAELYIQAVSPESKTSFITVRFGNVLGSNGSVIPRFKEQIDKGGPVTVTHPEIIRYFMTIPEASGLVLQAGGMGEKGEIFILEMGEPVRIAYLAEQMIRLSGFEPYRDIKIEFTGLRPGEKLYEELLLNLEGLKPTRHPKVMIASSGAELNKRELLNKLEELFQLARTNRDGEIFDLFQEIIPEYEKHSNYIAKTVK